MCCKRNHKKNCPNWQQPPDHSRRLIVIGSSGTGKTNALLNVINQELYTDQIYYMLSKDLYEEKDQFLINERTRVNLVKFNILKLLFEDKIADMLSNKKLNQIVAKLFIRGI